MLLGRSAGSRAITTGCRTWLTGIHGLAQLQASLLERLHCALNPIDVVRLDRIAHIVDLALQVSSGGAIDFVTQFIQALLHLIGQCISLVARVSQLLAARVFRLMRLRLADHPLDLLLIQIGTGCDGDLLITAGCLVCRADV